MDSTNCTVCGSSKVIPQVRVIDQDYTSIGDLSAQVKENPDALVFKGKHLFPIHAKVCGECGHASLFVESPGALWEVYQRLDDERRRIDVQRH